MTTRERLQGEKEALGLYLTGHPIDEYVQELKHICKSPIGELRAEKKTQWVSGMVVNVRVMRSRRGAPMGFLVLDDRSARLEVSLFPECYEKFGRKVAKDELLIVEGEVQQDEFSGGLALRAERVYTIAEARERFCLGLVIDYSEADMPGDFSQRLKRVLSPHRTEQDGCNICVLYGAERARARISLGEDWRVSPSDDLLQTLRTEFDGRIHLDYARG
jgi:DNA polymerase-3 subunit alpha